MEVKNENIIRAYNAADDSGKAMLCALFPDLDLKGSQTEQDNRPITERVKTLDDAMNIIGYGHPFVSQYLAITTATVNEAAKTCADAKAFMALRIICAALNEGWEPNFKLTEWRWYPWFRLWTKEELSEKREEWKRARSLIYLNDNSGCAGFSYADTSDAPTFSSSYVSSRLCLHSKDLATYCGKQFTDLWLDFYLIRKRTSHQDGFAPLPSSNNPITGINR